MSRAYLGVDADNSKTVALVADADGRILGRGRGGNGDISGTATEKEAVDAVAAAVGAAMAAAAKAPWEVAAAAFRLAGVDWPEDEAYWADAAARRLPGLHRLSIKNDGFALLRCGDVSGVGVAVTAGTGPAVAARGRNGQEYCASWWIQHALGGHGLGQAAFRAVVDAHSSLGPPTVLTRQAAAAVRPRRRDQPAARVHPPSLGPFQPRARNGGAYGAAGGGGGRRGRLWDHQL